MQWWPTPSAAVENCAVPPLSGDVPRSLEPFINVTVPVGIPEALGVTVAENVTARARLKAAGIRVGFFIQLGYLGEQLEDILATRALLDEAVPDDVGISVSYPLPGTKFYEIVEAQLPACEARPQLLLVRG